MMRIFAFAGSAVLVVLAGCSMLPPKKTPAPKLVDHAPLAGLPLGEKIGAAWPAAEWWKAYRDPTLDELERLGLATSPTLDIAQRRFDLARQTVRQTGAALGVQVELNGDVSRQRLSENGFIPPRFLGFTWYNQADLGLQATYSFDWWGKQRAAIGAAIDSAHASAADASAAAILLESSIADAYFGWQLDQARLQLARERIANGERAEGILQARIRAELESPDSVRSDQAQTAQAREQAAALEGSAQLRRVTLAALVGRSAADLPPLTAHPLPPLAQELPDNAGIDLLARRADIAASRWRIEAAQKTISEARAAYFPDISLRAMAGFQSIEISRLLNYGSRVPLASAAIHLPIFDSGRLATEYGATRAQLGSAIASYQDSLVTAAREVATEATSRQQAIAQRTQRIAAVAAADDSRRAAVARMDQGLTDLRPVLSASDDWIAQRDALLQLDAAALSHDIGLQRALGGGYQFNVSSPTS